MRRGLLLAALALGLPAAGVPGFMALVAQTAPGRSRRGHKRDGERMARLAGLGIAGIMTERA